MDKNAINMLVGKLVKRWGSTKFTAVAALTAIGASISCLASASLIPNDPDPEEPQNETKSTKTKKENA